MPRYYEDRRYLKDVRGILKKWFRDIVAIDDGGIPYVIPDVHGDQ